MVAVEPKTTTAETELADLFAHFGSAWRWELNSAVSRLVGRVPVGVLRPAVENAISAIERGEVYCPSCGEFHPSLVRVPARYLNYTSDRYAVCIYCLALAADSRAGRSQERYMRRRAQIAADELQSGSLGLHGLHTVIYGQNRQCGLVYIARQRATTVYKIGATRRNPAARIAALPGGHHQWEQVAAIKTEDCFGLEAHLHAMLAALGKGVKYGTSREMFTLTDSDLASLLNLKSYKQESLEYVTETAGRAYRMEGE